MSENCLLIKTKDNRNFLTYEKNLQSLIEYAKTFDSEIELVKVSKNAKILELKALTVALCDPGYKFNASYTKIESVYPKSKKDRQSILSDANAIREFIRKKFLSGDSVSLKELKEQFGKNKLTDACLCNHMTVIRKKLTKEGYSFNKVGAGKYCLKAN